MLIIKLILEIDQVLAEGIEARAEGFVEREIAQRDASLTRRHPLEHSLELHKSTKDATTPIAGGYTGEGPSEVLCRTLEARGRFVELSRHVLDTELPLQCCPFPPTIVQGVDCRDAVEDRT